MAKAYLEITLTIDSENREKAAGVYQKYRAPFLTEITGAKSKDLLLRKEDVQVLHGFDSEENANAYLKSTLFSKDIVNELSPLLKAQPEIRIYSQV